MLKVEFVRYKNVLCATILEQGDEIKRGDFKFKHNGYTLETHLYPDMATKGLCLQGKGRSLDHSSFCHRYNTEEQAKEALQGFKAAIEAYNASLLSEREQQTTDIETVVVG